MTNKSKPSFLRLFISGFALGVVGLVGFQAAHADRFDLIPAVHAAVR